MLHVVWERAESQSICSICTAHFLLVLLLLVALWAATSFPAAAWYCFPPLVVLMSRADDDTLPTPSLLVEEAWSAAEEWAAPLPLFTV